MPHTQENIEETAHATAETGGVAASLGINASLFAFQLLNFAIVVAIVWFLILRPLTKKMEERKKIIDDSLDKAKEVETNLILSEQKFQEKIDEAKAEANRIMEKTFAESERAKEEMKGRAKKEIELLVDQAKKNIQTEKEETIAEIKKETVDIVIAAVEKILEEKINPETDKKIIENALKTLKK